MQNYIFFFNENKLNDSKYDRRPPLIDEIDCNKGRYDSVLGNTRGSDVYILYIYHSKRYESLLLFTI